MSSERWDKIEELLSAARALPEEERAVFLREHCEDEALRREVTSLLEHVDEAPGYFKRLSSVLSPVRDEIQDRKGGPIGSDPLELEGQNIGRYVVESYVGGGGMGVVYRAYDPELDRQVALKFLSPFLGEDAGARERFVKEARAVARLNHANICTIHDFHEQEGRPVLVMEYIDGTTLRERLREGPLSVELVLDVATQTTQALAAAHHTGIIHRDIKPGNVMVTTEGQVKVMDFGIAKLKDSQPITKTGDTMGTVPYMAPEQIQGRKVDHRADLFSFGMVLYEMLTGHHPFGRGNEKSVAYRIVNEDPEPPSAHRSDIPPKLDALILRCLAKNPENRYASAREMLQLLRWDETPTSRGLMRAVSKGESFQMGGYHFRRRPVLGGALIGIVAMAVLLGLWLISGETGSGEAAVDEDLIAVFPFAVLGDPDLEYYGEGMVDLLTPALDGAGTIRTVDPNTLLSQVRQKSSADVFGYDEALSIAAGFRAGRFVLGSIYYVGEEIRLHGYWYDADGEELGRAQVAAADIQSATDELARRVIVDLVGEDTDDRALVAAQTTTSSEALKAYLEGQGSARDFRWTEARDAFERAVDADTSFALAYHRLALAASYMQDVQASIEAQRRAVAFSEDLPGRDRRVIQARHAVGEGRADDAERLYKSIVRARPDDEEAWFWLGETLFHGNAVRGRLLAEAREPLERAIALEPRRSKPITHLIQLAVLEQDLAALDSLTAGSGYGAGVQAVRAYLLSDGPDRELEEHLRASPVASWFAAYLLLPGEHLEEVEEVVGSLINPDHDREVRARGHIWMAELIAARGQLEAARDELLNVAELDGAAYLTARGRFLTLPFLPEAEQQGRRLQLDEQLSRWDAEDVPERLLFMRYLAPPELYPPVRLYLLGLLRAAEGDAAGARNIAGRLNEMDPPSLAPSGPSDFARSVEAELARIEGRPEVALNRLRSLKHNVPLILKNPYRLYASSRERFLRAELLAETGQYEEALAWYETFNGVIFSDIPYLAPAHLGRAQVLEELGRTDEAAKAYERFLELWDDADPIFQPKVEKAQERFITLAAE